MSINAPGDDVRSGNLLKILGVTFGIAVTIGGMIGLGILRTPGLVAAQLPDAWLILLVWVLVAGYALLGTMSIAELATSIPKAGGWYTFVRRALGEYPAFLIGWMDWLAFPIGIAATAITVGEYAAAISPSLGNMKLAAALTPAVGLGLLNWIGLRAGSRVQEATSFAKATVLLVLVAACFVLGGDSAAQPAAAAEVTRPIGLVATLGAIVIALQSVLYTFDGWQNSAYFVEENKNPSQSLPRGMILGLLSVAGIYLLINLALLYVLEIPQLANSVLPVADAAEMILGVNGKLLITAIAIISLLSIMNASLMIAPRVIFAMSRDGLFVRKGAEVNKGGTPTFGLGLTIAVTVFLIQIGSFETLLAMSAFMYVTGYLSGFISLVALRRNEPGLERPFKTPFYPWTPMILLTGSALFLVGMALQDTRHAVYAAGLMLLTYPAYLILIRFRKD